MRQAGSHPGALDAFVALLLLSHGVMSGRRASALRAGVSTAFCRAVSSNDACGLGLPPSDALRSHCIAKPPLTRQRPAGNGVRPCYACVGGLGASVQLWRAKTMNDASGAVATYGETWQSPTYELLQARFAVQTL